MLARQSQLVKAVGQIAQAGQHGGASPMGRATGILAQRDITPVVGAVFNGRPMGANERQKPRVVMLLQAQARGVVVDLDLGIGLRLGRVKPSVLDGNDLPAATEPDLLWADGDARDTPPLDPAMAFLPRRVGLRGKRPAGRAGVGLFRGCRFDCLSIRRDNRFPTPG